MDKEYFALISIVAIVAVVGLIVFTMGSRSNVAAPVVFNQPISGGNANQVGGAIAPTFEDTGEAYDSYAANPSEDIVQDCIRSLTADGAWSTRAAQYVCEKKHAPTGLTKFID